MTEPFHIMLQVERSRQEEKWGEQNHHPIEWLAILAEEFGETARAVNQTCWPKGAGHDIGDVEKELIHTAAVCQAMWEAGKRNGWL